MINYIVKKIISRIYPFRRARFYLQRLTYGANNRKKFARLLSKLLPELPESLKGKFLSELGALDEDGYVMLPDLVKGHQIDEALDYLNSKPVYDRWNKSAGLFMPDQPPDDCHSAPYKDIDVLMCPHFLNWANDPKILSIVGQFLGGKPTLSNLTAWWSYPGHEEPQEAENFHRDVDHLKFVKLFVYLTEVDGESGPHVFVPGSQDCESFRKIQRYTDYQVETFFGAEKVKYFKGPAGTAFLENTFGLHKGQLPKSKRRLIFQAQYSLGPIGIYEYSPIKRGLQFASFDLDPYVNRLYLYD